MGFFSPWWLLAGGLLASVPVWLHLLRQHRNEPRKFSSLMFFERSIQSSVKHRRLKHLLLMALRLAIVILLGLLFAQPFLKRPLGSGDGDKLVVLAIDRSFSTHATGVLDRAKSAALAELGKLRKQDRVQVLALNGRVEQLTQVLRQPEEARSAIAALTPGDGAATLAEIARTMRTLAASAPGRIELHLFSDFQKSALPANFGDLQLPASVGLVLHPLVDKDTANFAVEAVKAPRQVSDPKQARVQATVAGFNTPVAKKDVALVVNGRTIATKTVDLPASGRASVEFIGIEANYGWNRGEIRIAGGDALPADDGYRFSLERSDARKVLFVRDARQARAALYYRAALEAAAPGAFTVEEFAPEQSAALDPSRYAFTVLCDPSSLPESFAAALRTAVREGHGALIAAGPGLSARGKVPLLDWPIEGSRYAARAQERFLAVSEVDAAHPALQRVEKLAGVKFFQALQTKAPETARVVARLSDATPLLLEAKSGAGRILVLASTLDNIANDWPLHASFVPFIAQSASFLSGSEGGAAAQAVDSFVELRAADGAARKTAVELIDPAGRRALSLEEAARATTAQLDREGFWELTRDTGRREVIAVNADRRESNLALMPPESRELWAGSKAAAAGAAATAESTEEKKSLYWPVLLALLIAVLAESWLSARYLAVARSA
jgi:hypothetical protein